MRCNKNAGKGRQNNKRCINLEIANLQKLRPIDTREIRKIARGVLKAEKRGVEIDVVFVDNKKIQEINKTFLNHNYATDVLSFPYQDDGATLAGEVIVSVEMAAQVARERGCAVEDEIALYLVHGLLHLLGYGDKQKKAAAMMRQREGELLVELGYDKFNATP